MDLNYSPEERAFRDEVRGWLEANLPADLKQRVANFAVLTKEETQRWHGILSKKGWVAPAWPVEWGGTGWNVVERYIFEEECGYAGCPQLPALSLMMCAPVLIRYGTEAQKKRFLPRIHDGSECRLRIEDADACAQHIDSLNVHHASGFHRDVSAQHPARLICSWERMSMA